MSDSMKAIGNISKTLGVRLTPRDSTDADVEVSTEDFERIVTKMGAKVEEANGERWIKVMSFYGAVRVFEKAAP